MNVTAIVTNQIVATWKIIEYKGILNCNKCGCNNVTLSHRTQLLSYTCIISQERLMKN